ncbi:hypothetical protein ANCCEY_07473 [Ancylostoma ceylanicum]|uniref:Uncharacterized protein n=1 Tax=Ancylostoma ceylanicum TaxID=53326 RepID=A0A0D6LTS9_9BILA|nr:hypothetical protein ANCCEY_07473 [Ancylostoma ceylanicum]
MAQIEEGVSAIETSISKLEKTLHEFASMVDLLEKPSSKEEEDFETYACKAEAILSIAFDYVIVLQARHRAMSSCANSDSMTSPRQSTLNDSINQQVPNQ